MVMPQCANRGNSSDRSSFDVASRTELRQKQEHWLLHEASKHSQGSESKRKHHGIVCTKLDQLDLEHVRGRKEKKSRQSENGIQSQPQSARANFSNFKHCAWREPSSSQSHKGGFPFMASIPAENCGKLDDCSQSHFQTCVGELVTLCARTMFEI